ncbi:MAG: ATP-dependent DNA helicase [Elusimicrobiaceae bacterium]|nr:ATP-dependent DNA helicase [Elusimicrobiaceae bacterium]
MKDIFPGGPGLELQVRALLSENGAAGECLAGFEPRSSQIEMSAGVARALESGQRLVVQAGTGVGKSLAYLLPAAIWACDTEKHIVVATYTRALQTQLVEKDLPLVRRILDRSGRNFSYALLMGAENYLCVRRLAGAAAAGAELFDSAGGAKLLDSLKRHAGSACTGLRNAIPFPVPAALWERVRREADLCLKKRCPLRERCLYMKDLHQAMLADVLVVNQHLYFAGLPVPAYHAVIFDEAHNVEDTAAEFLGFSVSWFRVGKLLAELYTPAGGGRGLVTRITNRPDDWRRGFETAVLSAGKAADNFFLSCARNAGLKITAVSAESKSARVTRPDLAEDVLSEPLLRLAEQLGSVMETAATEEEETILAAYKNRLLEVVSSVRAFLKPQGRDSVYWLETRMLRGAPEIELRKTLLDVSRELDERLFSRALPVVLTSATLAVDGSFESLRSALGINSCAELILPSPFDYRANAVLYSASSLPDPGPDSEAFETRSLARIIEIIRVVPGGVFVLFTSWEFLRRAKNFITGRVTGREVFVQGEMLADDLLRSFRRSGNGVLLATETFWQGVDVPGSNLACVIITKLPFASPGSPVEAGRQEYLASKGVNVFSAHTLPRAVIKFHQGFGRLIRKSSDYGAVAVLDPRIITRSYGVKFINSVPECAYTSELAGLADFFEERSSRPPLKAQPGSGPDTFLSTPDDGGEDFRSAEYDGPSVWRDTPFL